MTCCAAYHTCHKSSAERDHILHADSWYRGCCLGSHGVQNRLWHRLPGPGGVPATAGLRGPCAGNDFQLGVLWFCRPTPGPTFHLQDSGCVRPSLLSILHQHALEVSSDVPEACVTFCLCSKSGNNKTVCLDWRYDFVRWCGVRCYSYGMRWCCHCTLLHHYAFSCLKTQCYTLGLTGQPNIPLFLQVDAQGGYVFFFRLMLRCGIKRGRIKNDVELKQLQQFWAFAGDANFSPPLGQQEAAMLQQLGSIR